jgi:hypothetical protein
MNALGIEAMLAPELEVAHWLNSDEAPTLLGLRGRVVLIVAFQTHCTGCVMCAVPQLRRMSLDLEPRDVAVLGLHTAFERPDATRPQALAAFVTEHRLTCPVGADRPSDTRLPRTMRAYQMQGTPTTILIDRAGHLRMMHLGPIDDALLHANVVQLVRAKPE